MAKEEMKLICQVWLSIIHLDKKNGFFVWNLRALQRGFELLYCYVILLRTAIFPFLALLTILWHKWDEILAFGSFVQLSSMNKTKKVCKLFVRTTLNWSPTIFKSRVAFINQFPLLIRKWANYGNTSTNRKTNFPSICLKLSERNASGRPRLFNNAKIQIIWIS